LPNIGKIGIYNKPQGPGVRVDDCMEANMEIPIYYDNMIAKLVVHGPTREQAGKRMLRAISEYKITGIQTTLSFGNFVFNHPKFLAGDFDTNFIANYFSGDKEEESFSQEELEAIALVAANLNSSKEVSNETSNKKSAWLNRRTHN